MIVIASATAQIVAASRAYLKIMEKVNPLSKDLLQYAISAHRNERLYLCEQEFALFAMYYFPELFTYAVPMFQWLMYKALNEFVRGKWKFFMWIMFRESAKSTICKVFIVYCICYRKKRFINWDAYDKGNAESALFDIVYWLQTNRALIADFGQLYIEATNAASKQAKMKRISEFVTVNRVKVKAYSTQEATRGRVFDRWRPDLYIVEDFETAKTADSAPVTAKVLKHMDELKAGLSVEGQVIFLGNLITESGSVASLLAEAKENPESWYVHRVDVEDKDTGEIAWPDKYVATREEARQINEARASGKKVISLEQLRKDLNASGRKVYEAEMLNNPEAAGDQFFDRERADRDIARAKRKPPIKNIGGLSIWEEYSARHTNLLTEDGTRISMPRYAFGGDTAKGVKRDSCASVGIRFALKDKEKSIVVGTYASNTIKPDAFGDEMAAHGRLYGECLLAPELNNTGYATVTRLKAIYLVHRIYRRIEEGQIGEHHTRDLGWEARPGAVEGIYYNFRAAYDGGEIEIFCLALLAEIRAFTKRDLEQSTKKREDIEGAGVITKHFDLLRAACIAWEMRAHAMPTAPKKKTSTKPYQIRSEYEGTA